MTQQKRRPVVVLGSTGAVGQRFIEGLSNHPWFELTAVAASDRRAGERFEDSCNWLLSGQPPVAVSSMRLSKTNPAEIELETARRPIAFSALPAAVAREVEPEFARAGYAVFSNASAFRAEDDVPLLIPEVNLQHAPLIRAQRDARGWPGFIVTNPNCTTTGIALALKPLDDAFGICKVFATTLQAISGAGYPGIPSLDVLDNVIPWIPTEEEKIEQELRLLLGELSQTRVEPSTFEVSAQANRVPVLDGHTICLSVGFEQPVSPEAAIEVLGDYRGNRAVQGLPSAPSSPLVVRESCDRPQPRLDRDACNGMAATVGRVRPCPILDLRLVAVVHNTIRGAALGSILNAEAFAQSGWLDEA